MFIATISMATGDSTRGDSYLVWVDQNFTDSKCTIYIVSYKSVCSQCHCAELWSSELERLQPRVCTCSKYEQLRLCQTGVMHHSIWNMQRLRDSRNERNSYVVQSSPVQSSPVQSPYEVQKFICRDRQKQCPSQTKIGPVDMTRLGRSCVPIIPLEYLVSTSSEVSPTYILTFLQTKGLFL